VGNVVDDESLVPDELVDYIHRAPTWSPEFTVFAEDFAGRMLPFEAGAATRNPEIVLACRQAGNPIEKF
jgi:hypothetical protein